MNSIIIVRVVAKTMEVVCQFHINRKNWNEMDTTKTQTTYKNQPKHPTK